MRAIFIFLMFVSLPAVADVGPEGSYCRVVCSKPVPKKKKKLIVPVKQPVHVCAPCVARETIKIVKMPVVVYPAKVQSPIVQVNSEPVVGLGVRGAIGLRSCDRPVVLLGGVRGRLFPLRLGIDLNLVSARGPAGAQLLFYPFQDPKNLSWYVGAGVSDFASTDRGGALRSPYPVLSTGIELPIVRHLSFTADAYGMLRSDRQSLLTLMAGLMLHSW